MRKLFVLLALALCGAALWAGGGAEATVKIDGKTLDQIDDIMMLTTGSHQWPVNSFIECVAKRGSPLSLWPFRRDEKGDWKADMIDKHDVEDKDKNDENKRIMYGYFGVHTAVGAQRRRKTEDGRVKDDGLTVMWPADKGGSTELSFAQVKMGDDFKLTAEPKSVVIDMGYPLLTDATGSLFPKGEHDDKEWFTDLFVVAYKTSSSAWVDIVDPDPETGKKRSVPLGEIKGDNAVARVAVGDLDNDGKANEFAVIFGDGGEDRYRLQIYRVTED